MEALKVWWARDVADRACAHTTELLAAWWDDLGEHPRLHFVSMMLGIAIYFAIRIAVWLAA
jgi:hypothetical protein